MSAKQKTSTTNDDALGDPSEDTSWLSSVVDEAANLIMSNLDEHDSFTQEVSTADTLEITANELTQLRSEKTVDLEAQGLESARVNETIELELQELEQLQQYIREEGQGLDEITDVQSSAQQGAMVKLSSELAGDQSTEVRDQPQKMEDRALQTHMKHADLAFSFCLIQHNAFQEMDLVMAKAENGYPNYTLQTWRTLAEHLGHDGAPQRSPHAALWRSTGLVLFVIYTSNYISIQCHSNLNLAPLIRTMTLVTEHVHVD